MSDKYEVIWAATAVDDLTDIVAHVANNSPADALRILKKIKEASSQLYHLPERGRIVPELQDQGIMQYRELIVTPWRVMYRIAGKNVFVLSVLDSRRNVEDILLDRLTRPVVD
ncbi:MAG TPA: type II toxin-antitoxin system RelE/ParE family toxin [Candidatus Acetothermia bacterium]|nr:type II toxin-antitoxin system RelE/ParE family toxin [Candidatus Acetothermia bacterium]